MLFSRYVAAIAFAGAANMAILVGASDARTITTTYTGKVTSGFDLTGMFIQPQAQFAGEDFTASFRIDLSPPQNCDLTESRTDSDSSVRITNFGGCPAVFLDLTIAGRTAGIGGRREVIQSQFDDGSEESFSHNLQSMNYLPFGAKWIYSVGLGGNGDGADFLTGPAWQSLTTAQAMQAPLLSGSFQFSFVAGDGDVFQNTYGTFLPLTVIVDSGAPEPSAWLLMLAGFGLVGTLARRSGQSRNRSHRPRHG